MPTTDARLMRRSKSSRIRDVLRMLKKKGGPQRGDLANLARHFKTTPSVIGVIWGQVQDEH